MPFMVLAPGAVALQLDSSSRCLCRQVGNEWRLSVDCVLAGGYTGNVPARNPTARLLLKHNIVGKSKKSSETRF